MRNFIYNRQAGTMILRAIILIFPLMIALHSCKVSYSFTGASIPPEMETISVQYFTNRASIVNPMLARYITDELKDKFQRQTDLTLVNGMGDANLEGEITRYSSRPTAISGNETAALNRFTISVRVKYTNTLDEEMNFNEVFTHYEDYASNKNLSEVEDELMETIIEQIIEDIYNRTFVNW